LAAKKFVTRVPNAHEIDLRFGNAAREFNNIWICPFACDFKRKALYFC